MSKSIAYKHLLRGLSRWPKDPLRPDIQLQEAIRRRIDRSLDTTATSDKNSAPSTSTPALTPVWNEAAELEQANILYSLLDGRYTQKYPLTKILTPASNPTHYKDLIREIEEAPTRSWWGRQLKSWKGFLRFK